MVLQNLRFVKAVATRKDVEELFFFVSVPGIAQVDYWQHDTRHG
jgi:hypothetical protein